MVKGAGARRGRRRNGPWVPNVMQNAMIWGAGCVKVDDIGVGIVVVIVVVRREDWRLILLAYEGCGEGNVQVCRCLVLGCLRSTVLEVGDLGQIDMTRRVAWRVAVLYYMGPAGTTRNGA